MAVSTQNNVDADGTGPQSRNETAHNVKSIDKDKITPDCAPISDHTSRSNSDHKDMEKDVQKPGRSETPRNTPKRSKRKIALIMTALAACYAKLYNLAVFLAALDVVSTFSLFTVVTIVATAIPTITEDFHAPDAYTWIGSAYLLSTSASVTIWGKLSDIFGRKPILVIANIIFLVGSLIAALSRNIGQLLSARAIQGAGGGGLVVLSNIVIGDMFSQRERGTYYGVTGAVWAFASSIGPIVGGAFTQNVDWRWCFYVNLPLDGLSLILIVLILDVETPKTPILAGFRAIDWSGCLLMVAATLLLLFGLEYGGQSFPWNSATVICLIVVGIFCFVVFLVNEWKLALYPIIPLRIFNRGSTVACLVVCFCHGCVFIAGSYYLPLYFQAVLGATPILSGVYVLPSALALALFAASTGHFIRITGKVLPPIFFGFILMTLGFGLYIDLDRTSGWAKIVIYQIIAGCGVGPLFQSPLIAMQSFIKPGDIAAATSTFAWARMLACASSVVAGQAVFQNVMAKKKMRLTASLGGTTAADIGGNNAGSNTRIIDSLPTEQRTVAQDAFADSLHYMWIMYMAISVVGFCAAFWIGYKRLDKQHQEIKTGLDAEAAKRAEALNESQEGQQKVSDDVEKNSAKVPK